MYVSGVWAATAARRYFLLDFVGFTAGRGRCTAGSGGMMPLLGFFGGCSTLVADSSCLISLFDTLASCN
jgi:hypothetical protein